MPGTNEAFSRVRIDAQLKEQGWDVVNTSDSSVCQAAGRKLFSRSTTGIYIKPPSLLSIW